MTCKVKSRHWKQMHELGIKPLHSCKEASAFDQEKDAMFWTDAIAKEMKNVKVAFNVLDDGKVVPLDHQFVKCHMVFDVKLEDF